jgi:hypothetical protein
MCEWKRETWEEEVRKNNQLCLAWMKEMEKDMQRIVEQLVKGKWGYKKSRNIYTMLRD